MPVAQPNAQGAQMADAPAEIAKSVAAGYASHSLVGTAKRR
jgi:hypothetical protein